MESPSSGRYASRPRGPRLEVRLLLVRRPCAQATARFPAQDRHGTDRRLRGAAVGTAGVLVLISSPGLMKRFCSKRYC